MQLSYDPRHNIAYIRLHQKTAGVQTIRVSDEVNIDIAPDGTVYGIELLNANDQLKAEDHGKLVVVNQEGGERQEIAFGSSKGKREVRRQRGKRTKRTKSS